MSEQLITLELLRQYGLNQRDNTPEQDLPPDWQCSTTVAAGAALNALVSYLWALQNDPESLSDKLFMREHLDTDIVSLCRPNAMEDALLAQMSRLQNMSFNNFLDLMSWPDSVAAREVYQWACTSDNRKSQFAAWCAVQLMLSEGNYPVRLRNVDHWRAETALTKLGDEVYLYNYQQEISAPLRMYEIPGNMLFKKADTIKTHMTVVFDTLGPLDSVAVLIHALHNSWHYCLAEYDDGGLWLRDPYGVANPDGFGFLERNQIGDVYGSRYFLNWEQLLLKHPEHRVHIYRFEET